MQAVIMAGGFGKRMEALYSDIPKPMIKVCGKPVLERQIENLRQFGITDIIIVVHHLADKIIGCFADGSDFGVNITYYNETVPLGTAGALFKIKDRLQECFLLINGDLIFDINFSALLDFHKEKNALATLFVHPNTHPGDSELVAAGRDGRVTGWVKNDGELKRNCVNAGIHVLSKKLLEGAEPPFPVDLRGGLICSFIPGGRVFAYRCAEYVRDMGTPERLEQVTADLESGLVGARRSDKKQRAVFLDRDGTINKYKGYITSPKQIDLYKGAAQAVRRINESGYLAIVITNQPQISMGMITFEQLDEIHARLEALLAEEGAYLDDIYFCPHHPDSGFQGEVKELKIKCGCRKPASGMLRAAAEKYNIDLTKSFMVGDSGKDALAGKDCGCQSAYLLCGNQKKIDFEVKTYKNLADFVKKEID